jgi:hypothetical protein
MKSKEEKTQLKKIQKKLSFDVGKLKNIEGKTLSRNSIGEIK